MLGAGSRSGHRQAQMVFPIYSARSARLGFHANPHPARHAIPWRKQKGARVGQPQRLLLSGGSHLRNILNGQSLRQADLGQRLRRRRRPELIPGNEPTPEGNDRVWPGVDGGANWMSHSYSPLTRLLYIFAREEHRMFSKNALPHPTTEPAANAIAAPTTMAQANAGAYDPAIGGAITRAVGTPEESWGKVIAVDPGTGNIKWEHRVLTPPWGGVMR